MEKTFFQRLVAMILLILIFPLLIILMIIIRMESRGNPLFKQKRVGRNGKIFIIYKLRTMRLGEQPNDIYSEIELALNQSYRITKIGKFLRNYYIDEIPQLINIFKGEMSFVGPRPNSISIASKKYYFPKEKNMLPGLTGLEQISFMKKIEGYDISKLNKFYYKKRNFKLNSFIIFLTLKFIFIDKIFANKTTN